MILVYLLGIPVLLALFVLIFLKLREIILTRRVYNVKTGKPIYASSIFRVFHLLFCKDPKKTVIEMSEETFEGKDGIAFSWQLFQSGVQIRAPELASQVLKDIETYVKEPPILFKEGLDFLGTQHLVLVNGPIWHRQRKVLDPAFISLESYQSLFEEKTKYVMTKVLTGRRIESTLDVTQKMALDILGLAIFGYDFRSLFGETSNEYDAYDRMMHSMNNFKNAFYYLIKELIMPWSSNPHLKKEVQTFNELCNRLIFESRKKEDSKNFSMLDMMVASQGGEDGLTDQEIRDNISIFFLAGHETTANALGFAVYQLAEYPELQESLRKEITDAVKENTDASMYASVRNLEGLQNFVKENLRFFPPVSLIPAKITSKDTVLGDVFIPKGTYVSVNTWAIHHSKEVYGDPEVFRPDRWKREESKNFPHGSFLPFSLGKRICIGNNFSLMEQKIFLAELLTSFKISKVNKNDHPRIDPNSTLFQSPLNYPLVFEKL